MTQSRTRRISHPFLIGLFVIVGTVLLVITIIWLGRLQFLKQQELYSTYFEGSVEGLEVGSAVKYLGVPCGRVSRISVAPDGRLVEVLMQIDTRIDVNDSLRVKSEFAGIAGGKFLQLHYPDNPEIASKHPVMSFVPKYPLIKSTPSGLDEIEIAGREIVNNLRAFKFHDISTEMLGFLDVTSKFFTNPKIYETIDRLSESSGRLQSILTRADTSRIINNIALTSDRLLQTSVELERFTENLSVYINNLKLNEKFDRAFSKYDSAVDTVTKMINIVGYRSENLIYSLTETLEEIRSTNRQIQKSLRDITNNPAKVFFSEPPPKDK